MRIIDSNPYSIYRLLFLHMDIYKHTCGGEGLDENAPGRVAFKGVKVFRSQIVGRAWRRGTVVLLFKSQSAHRELRQSLETVH